MKRNLLNVLTLISLIILIISLSTWIISSPAYSVIRGDSQFILVIPLNEATRTQMRQRDPEDTRKGWQSWIRDDKPTFSFGGIALHRFHTTSVNYLGIAIPYWSLALFSSILPLIWLIRSRLRRQNKSSTCCPSCGYDIRATPERCPECGAIPQRELQAHRT